MKANMTPVFLAWQRMRRNRWRFGNTVFVGRTMRLPLGVTGTPERVVVYCRPQFPQRLT